MQRTGSMDKFNIALRIESPDAQIHITKTPVSSCLRESRPAVSASIEHCSIGVMEYKTTHLAIETKHLYQTFEYTCYDTVGDVVTYCGRKIEVR